MSLTTPIGRGPFEPVDRHTDVVLPEHVVYWEPWPRRMRAVRAGRTVLDSERGIMLWRTGMFPALYFPRGDIDARLDEDVLEPAPSTGGADAALRDFVAIDSAAVDGWFDEDEPVYAHVRDPYHRVDVRASSRRVTVAFSGRVVADSSRPKLLFETGNPTRYYLPFVDVDLGVLERSDTVSQCPYKGDGQHWNLVVGDHGVSDAAWSLPHPLPEAVHAAEHLCFYPHKIELRVDGRHVAD